MYHRYGRFFHEPMTSVLAYITAANAKEARMIAESLLSQKLIACANLLPIESMYVWKGKQQRQKEALLLCKTQKKLMKKIIAAVRAMHGYDCPCVVFVKIEDGDKRYLQWASDALLS